jgi:cytochrome c oxidase subunit 1
MNLTFFPMHFLGAMGMARRTWTYDAGVGWEFWNFVATMGAYTLGIGILLNLINGFRSWRAAVPAPSDPWDAATLEWSMPTPIPHYNFAKVPVVHSDRPFWDEKHEGGPPVNQDVIAGPGPHHPHMPNSSYWPILAAFSQVLFMIATMLGRGHGGFDPAAFKLQAMVQVPLALIFLAMVLAWVKEDPYAQKGHAH